MQTRLCARGSGGGGGGGGRGAVTEQSGVSWRGWGGEDYREAACLLNHAALHALSSEPTGLPDKRGLGASNKEDDSAERGEGGGRRGGGEGRGRARARERGKLRNEGKWPG